MLNIVKKSFLTEKAVRPVGKKLIFSSIEERYNRLAVQRTLAANGHSYTILFLLTGTHIINADCTGLVYHFSCLFVYGLMSISVFFRIWLSS